MIKKRFLACLLTILGFAMLTWNQTPTARAVDPEIPVALVPTPLSAVLDYGGYAPPYGHDEKHNNYDLGCEATITGFSVVGDSELGPSATGSVQLEYSLDGTSFTAAGYSAGAVGTPAMYEPDWGHIQEVSITARYIRFNAHIQVDPWNTPPGTYTTRVDEVHIYGTGCAAPTPTPTPEPTPTPTPEPTPTPTPEPTPTPTPTPTSTPTPTPTPSPTTTPTPTPTATPIVVGDTNPPTTPTPTPVARTTPTPSSTPTPTSTPSPTPSVAPNNKPTPTPIARTNTPTPSPAIVPPRIAGVSSFLFNSHPLNIAEAIALTTGFALLVTYGDQSFGRTQAILEIPHLLRTFWINVASKRKRVDEWGRVVSSLTNDGIAHAAVAIYDFDRYGKLVERTVTDTAGRFGFLTPVSGKYTLRVYHPAYSFPARLTHDGYHGELLTIDAEKAVQFDIPLDPVQLHARFYQQLERAYAQLEVLRLPLLILGTMMSIANLIAAANIVNFLLMAYYVGLWIWEMQHRHTARHTLVVTDSTGKPLAFAIVRLINEARETVLTKATDAQGRVLTLAPQGNYTLDITPSGDHSAMRHVAIPLALTHGVLQKEMRIQLTHG